MKIGIISSGNENLALFEHLNKFNHDYILYYDQNNSFLGDKDFDFWKEKIIKGIETLLEKKCEKIIIDPVFELAFYQDKTKNKKHHEYSEYIIPLFSLYLHNYCFKYSLIGKIGIFWDFSSIQKAQELITNEAKKYTLTEKQKTIKKFHFPLKYWTKETTMWKYFLNNLSFSNFMVNKIIKFDMRYFKNANIDTIIPLNYWYFSYQRTLSKYFTFSKQRFHKKEKLYTILDKYLETNQEEKYSITILANGTTHFIEKNKKLLRLLQKGKETKIKYL